MGIRFLKGGGKYVGLWNSLCLSKSCPVVTHPYSTYIFKPHSEVRPFFVCFEVNVMLNRALNFSLERLFFSVHLAASLQEAMVNILEKQKQAPF